MSDSEAPMTEPPAYYNTNDLRGVRLFDARGRALKQEDVALAVFRHYAPSRLTPEDVHQFMTRGTPITSTRRAITNLTIRGLLVKTTDKKPGMYRSPIHYWRLRVLEPEQIELDL